MGELIVKNVSYYGDKYFYNSPEFPKGVNIIEGENGNGKSTLMNLIYYCLGGDVPQFNVDNKNNKRGKHKEIHSDENQQIELRITINKNPYILRRPLGKNYISISDSSGNVETLSVNRKGNPFIFSDWFLEKLSISILDIYQGNKNFKLNIKDLFRLVYHDQNPDPDKIFKKTDVDSIVSDSEYIRKLIFQVLLGKSFEKYYKKLGESKKVEVERSSAKALLNEFESLSSQLYSSESEIMNFEHLTKEISESREILKRLESSRELLKNNRPKESDSAWSNLRTVKNKIMSLEIGMQDLREKYNSYSQDIFKYQKYKEGLIKEVTQLNKIIHTQNTLEIFHSDSCPFCLKEFNRKEGECYCGNTVDEETFEKFFFNSDEYWDLLKSRKKSVETVDLVIESSTNKFNDIDSQLKLKREEIENLKIQLKDELSKIDNESVDINKLDKIDDATLKVKNKIQFYEKRLEFQNKLLEYQRNYNKLDNNFKKIKRDVAILEAKASQEMDTVVDEFNTIYNHLMTNTLKNCTSARIDIETYDPIVDGGFYREASSKVSIRFNYYLTILIMSLNNDKVKFPKFLMIDTPRTAGIDYKQLNKLMAQLIDLPQDEFQIILTTGLNSYPNSMKNYVKETLTDDEKLLKLN